jgi:cytochrome c oxidase subunit 3
MDASLPVERPGNGKVALLVVLASESVFFATLIVAYIALRGQAAWPVEHTLQRLAIPLANTSILLLSALSAWRAEDGIRRGRQPALLGWLIGALLLGGIFVLGQGYEFSHAGMRVDDQLVGGVFFTLMGFHALHVLGGMVVLAIVWVRARLGDFSARRHDTVTVGVWFWYYVCAVWLVLFTALYLI